MQSAMRGREDSPRHFTCLSSKLRFAAGAREKRWEQLLQGTLAQLIHTAKHPRTCIQVIIQVIHDDGSLLAAAFNASVAALLDASIPMHSLFTAAALAITAEGKELLDPDCCEEEVWHSLPTLPGLCL
jgi:exosome complex component RRP46